MCVEGWCGGGVHRNKINIKTVFCDDEEGRSHLRTVDCGDEGAF